MQAILRKSAMSCRKPIINSCSIRGQFMDIHVQSVNDLCNKNWSKFNTSKSTNLERKNRFEALMLHFGIVNGPLTDRKCTTYES